MFCIVKQYIKIMLLTFEESKAGVSEVPAAQESKAELMLYHLFRIWSGRDLTFFKVQD